MFGPSQCRRPALPVSMVHLPSFKKRVLGPNKMMHIYRLTVVMMRLHSSTKFELVQWIRQRLGATLEAATMIGRTAHAASWRPATMIGRTAHAAFREIWPFPVPPDGASDGQCQIVYRGDSEIMAERIARFFC